MSTTYSRHADLASYSTRRPARLLPLLIILLLPLSACSFGSPSRGKATPPPNTGPSVPIFDFPAVDANYVYDQLYFMSSTFQQRESGFDRSPEDNGHQAFARYWAQQMQQNLRGFGPAITYDSFQGGWISRAADSPSYNVEVIVPGALHPEQVVVVGSHYDGMHVSQGSAFDDTSGCAILLGEARALGDYWRAHHLFPARTLRFVLFDAEEQGLLGSYHYVNSTVTGDTANIVAILNEEQSGFSYPVRFLGLASNPVIPLHVWNTYNGKTYFSGLIQTALIAVGAEMRTMGFTSVPYRGDHGQDVSLPVFTADQQSQVLVAGDALGGSDDAGFDEANVPALTFIAGDEGTYDPQTGRSQTPNIPDNEAYPFDTHDDTIQLMNGYASGATAKSRALALALEFQTM
ncbi:MAG TPA: M28 family peptidase, partial [Ktedonobacterales bacterium]|nr:M28 family peptidase [Ktedonobacterales bacterium]